jgi:hypothetical protein
VIIAHAKAMWQQLSRPAAKGSLTCQAEVLAAEKCYMREAPQQLRQLSEGLLPSWRSCQEACL